jgi:hypothetical protein
MDTAFAWADDAPELAAAKLFSPLPDGSFGVWPENLDTVVLFLSVQRCWAYRPMGGVSGMNWTLVRDKMLLKGLGRRRMQREAARLELMEGAIMEVIA